MAKPTLTYEHGQLYDCESLTGWVEQEDGNTGETTVVNDDWFKLDISGSEGNKRYWVYGPLGLSLSSNSYPKAVFRYKTSDSSIKAQIKLVFTVGEQTILDETSSLNWAVGTADITPDKTIDHVRLYANQATGIVYYDFALICQGIFTFPFVRPGGVRLNIPDAYLSTVIPNRVGDIKEYVGEESPTIEVTGEIDTNTNWGTATVLGHPLYRAVLRRNLDAWQWFTSDLIDCKVVPSEFDLMQDSEREALRVYSLTLKQFERSGGSNYTWYERIGK